MRGLELRAGKRMVVRPIHLPGLNDHDRCAICNPPLGRLVSAELRLVVPGHEPVGQVASVGLGNDLCVRVAEDVDRADVNGTGHARVHRGAEDTLGRADVALPHRRFSEARMPMR